jgi:hypothetical protein
VSKGATRIVTPPASALREFAGSGGNSVAGLTLKSEPVHDVAMSAAAIMRNRKMLRRVMGSI